MSFVQNQFIKSNVNMKDQFSQINREFNIQNNKEQTTNQTRAQIQQKFSFLKYIFYKIYFPQNLNSIFSKRELLDKQNSQIKEAKESMKLIEDQSNQISQNLGEFSLDLQQQL
ncbi:hypothetical protein TTHERM_000683148 (macronuclear) [Tetrahymena thermophila SB210]|uniref:Uncharacterized protein n=1 Tax=Tetrahymena thermophila (strain SB210) TaxID=312017 RepID=W7XE29_TETTS|nr:hypothetical protein TTHERM_000683148 [Tetrahymena thermophila SB210]EWS71114.1 hypothetical protein TTHERM_000683148 [Tetrahymena thermophila SB210]|eukprot:XP_012656357.1 hypothetical protein TTHERM_000683148 [Tetrahymena thermophila SB210]